MPHPRFDKLERERRAQILEAAGREFAEHGYEGTPLRRILEHMGMSKGSAYYYFDSKADLFGAVVRYHADRLLGEHGEALLRAFDGVDRNGFWPSWHLMSDRMFDESYESHRTLGLLRIAWQQSNEARETVDLTGVFERGYRFFIALIRRGREVGAVRDDLPEDLLVLALAALDDAFDRWVDRHQIDTSDVEIKKTAAEVWRLMQALLEPPQVAS